MLVSCVCNPPPSPHWYLVCTGYRLPGPLKPSLAEGRARLDRKNLVLRTTGSTTQMRTRRFSRTVILNLYSNNDVIFCGNYQQSLTEHTRKYSFEFSVFFSQRCRRSRYPARPVTIVIVTAKGVNRTHRQLDCQLDCGSHLQIHRDGRVGGRFKNPVVSSVLTAETAAAPCKSTGKAPGVIF